MSGLQVLNLMANDLGEAGAGALVPAMEKMSSLQELNLDDNNLSKASKALVPFLPAKTTKTDVTKLDLSFSQVGKAGAGTWAFLAWASGRMTALEELCLTGHELAEASACTLDPDLEKMAGI